MLEVLSRASEASVARPLRVPEVEARFAMVDRRTLVDGAGDDRDNESVDETARMVCEFVMEGLGGR